MSTGNRLVIKPSERVAIVGKTGSGKSYFARSRLLPVQRLVVCDPKGTLSEKYLRSKGNPSWYLEDWKTGYRKLLKGQPARVRIAPPDDDSEWDHYFTQLYKLNNVLVYIDELYGVGPSNSRGLRALYTRGRELGIGVWSATQRPSQIPLFALSEAEWIVLFQIRLQKDKQRMAELIGDVAETRLKNHGFILYNDHMENPIIYHNGL